MNEDDVEQGIWHMNRAIDILGMGHLVWLLVERDEAVAELAMKSVRALWAQGEGK